MCLLYGWVVPHAWIANPIALVAAVLYKLARPRGAFVFAVLAIVAAALAPVALGAGLRSVSGGYVAWLASLVCLAVATWRAKRARDRDPFSV